MGVQALPLKPPSGGLQGLGPALSLGVGWWFEPVKIAAHASIL